MVAQNIRVLALAIVEHNGNILAMKGNDSKKGETFYRLLGGGIDFGEMAEDALKREFKEETGEEITVKRLLKVTENLFEYEGKKGHEICFVFEAELKNKALNGKDIPMIEQAFSGQSATWVKPGPDVKIYPTKAVDAGGV